MSEHEMELDTELVCHICAQTFSNEEFLSAHVLEAHGGKEPATGSA